MSGNRTKVWLRHIPGHGIEPIEGYIDADPRYMPLFIVHGTRAYELTGTYAEGGRVYLDTLAATLLPMKEPTHEGSAPCDECGAKEEEPCAGPHMDLDALVNRHVV